MFTGLIQEVGRVGGMDRTGEGARLTVECDLAAGLTEGDSVSVDGACLTVTGLASAGFSVEAMNQTLEMTSLGRLAEGDRVNLEPALAAGQPLGGHLVQGHVDGVGEVVAVEPDGFSRRLTVGLPAPGRRDVIPPGARTHFDGRGDPRRARGAALGPERGAECPSERRAREAGELKAPRRAQHDTVLLECDARVGHAVPPACSSRGTMPTRPSGRQGACGTTAHATCKPVVAGALGGVSPTSAGARPWPPPASRTSPASSTANMPT